jgi:membrane-bound ClpP family serine protease
LTLIFAIALLVLGIALIVAEIYLVPGFNVIGIVGALLVLFAVGFTFMNRGIAGGGTMLTGAILALGVSFYFLVQAGAWDRFVLKTNLRKDDLVIARESEHRSSYLGKSGVAVSPLRPTGIVEIDGERIEVATEGEFISSGSTVRVVAMDRRRYFVRLDVEEDPVLS